MGKERGDAGRGCAASAGSALARSRRAVLCCPAGAMLRSRALTTSVAADLMALVFRSARVAAPAARPNY